MFLSILQEFCDLSRMLFDSHKNVVSGKNFAFWKYFRFSGGKLGDQNHQLWVRPISAQTLNFERLLRDYLFLMKYVPQVEISTNLSHISAERAQKPPKRGHFMDAALPRKHLKIYNLTTTNAVLMKLTTIISLHKTFILAEDWGVTRRA